MNNSLSLFDRDTIVLFVLFLSILACTFFLFYTMSLLYLGLQLILTGFLLVYISFFMGTNEEVKENDFRA